MDKTTTEEVYIGIDMGIFSTTAAILDPCCNLVGIDHIYNCEEDYPRIERVERKKGQRFFDPKPDVIALDHYNWMDRILNQWSVITVGIENANWNPYSDTDAYVNHFRGILNAVVIKENLKRTNKQVGFRLITPSQIKKVVTGNGAAKKNMVADAVFARYEDNLRKLGVKTVTALRKCNHIADAIGAARFLICEEIGLMEEEGF